MLYIIFYNHGTPTGFVRNDISSTIMATLRGYSKMIYYYKQQSRVAHHFL